MKSPFVLHQGDCIEILRGMPADSIDSCVTDPPYGIRFMGKAWDGKDIENRTSIRAGFSNDPSDKAGENGGHRSLAAEAGKYDLSPSANRAFQQFSEAWAREVLRVLKPGGYLLSFASTRTYHRMACGIEDAGFEIRDQLAWMFGSGFPKSHNLGGGYGTALKPAWEPITVARKPLSGTVAENFRAFQTGVLRIEDCRVPIDLALDGARLRTMNRGTRVPGSGWGMNAEPNPDAPAVSPEGRWPANVIHDGSDEVIAAFPEAGGAQGSVSGTEPSAAATGTRCFGKFARISNSTPRGDTGSAARFFYCAKASQAERDEGCEHLPQRASGMTSETSGQHITRRDGSAPGPAANFHPTVKPIALMRYLCRLVTPVGGTVLDPFVGSGTTGRAAIFEHLQFIGCEREADYVPIAQARIADAVGPLFA